MRILRPWQNDAVLRVCAGGTRKSFIVKLKIPLEAYNVKLNSGIEAHGVEGWRPAPPLIRHAAAIDIVSEITNEWRTVRSGAPCSKLSNKA